MATNYNYFGGIVTNGLVLDLDAAKLASYPGTGTTWYDISGNNNNGTLTNGPTFSGIGKQAAIVLDGVDDFISGSTLPNLLKGSSTFTISIWVYPTNLNNLGGGASGYRTLIDTPNRHLSLWLGTQGQGQYYGLGGASNAYSVNFNWENNKWQMITIIANPSNGEIIKNNYTTSETISNGGIFTQQVTFGNNPSSGGSNLQGSYGVIQMYNRVLSSTEVSQNFNALRGRYGI